MLASLQVLHSIPKRRGGGGGGGGVVQRETSKGTEPARHRMIRKVEARPPLQPNINFADLLQLKAAPVLRASRRVILQSRVREGRDRRPGGGGGGDGDKMLKKEPYRGCEEQALQKDDEEDESQAAHETTLNLAHLLQLRATPTLQGFHLRRIHSHPLWLIPPAFLRKPAIYKVSPADNGLTPAFLVRQRRNVDEQRIQLSTVWFHVDSLLAVGLLYCSDMLTQHKSVSVEDEVHSFLAALAQKAKSTR